MNPRFEKKLKQPVRLRIIEKRTKQLEDFVSSFSNEKLISVGCSPDRLAEPKRCFVNVEEKISRMGGRMITGWIFNEFEDKCILGEAHAIWLDKFEKKKIDITPHQFQPKRVLFLPDEKVAVKRSYTLAPKLILTEDPDMVAVEVFHTEIGKIKERNFKGMGEPMDIPKDEFEAAVKESNIPEDVALFLLQMEVSKDQSNFQKYGQYDLERRKNN